MKNCMKTQADHHSKFKRDLRVDICDNTEMKLSTKVAKFKNYLETLEQM